jgi:uncharacterized membrane protein YgdD (TMEM256/DUF423 family)
MDLKSRIGLALAALNGLIAVAAGAFGAHGVADLKARDWLRTGAQYELIHALAAIACLLLLRLGAGAAGLAAWLFLAGAALFSWSLYGLALSSQLWLGAVTPVGGLLLLAGWGALIWAALSGANGGTPPKA